MRGYLAILLMRIKVLCQYRAAAFAAIVAQVFWGILTTMVLRAFFLSSSQQEPLTLSQSLTFVWLGQALLQILPWTIDKDLETQIKSGTVSYELIRPLDLYTLCFVRSMALRLVPTLLRCAPVCVLGGWLFGLAAPVSWNAGLLFCVSVLCAGILASALTTLVLISLFWTLSGEGILRLMPFMSLLLSGTMVPLPLFPPWLQPFLEWQPFRGLIDIPCRIYTGVIPPDHVWMYVGFQIAWTAILIGLGRLLLGRAIRGFAIQGG